LPRVERRRRPPRPEPSRHPAPTADMSPPKQSESHHNSSSPPPAPTRAAPPRDGGGGAARRRRVVIDSHASRRPQGPHRSSSHRSAAFAPSTRWNEGGGRQGRRNARGPGGAADADQVGLDCQGGRGVHRNPRPRCHQEADGSRRDGTLTQTLADEALETAGDDSDRRWTSQHAAAVFPPPRGGGPILRHHEELVDSSTVVTIMGPVDHGKTSLSTPSDDEVRPARRRHHQHIGAYHVQPPHRKIHPSGHPGHQRSPPCAPASQGHRLAVMWSPPTRRMPQTSMRSTTRRRRLPVMVALTRRQGGADPNRSRRAGAANGLTRPTCGDTDFHRRLGQTKLRARGAARNIVTPPSSGAEATRTRRFGTVIESRLDPGRGPVLTVARDARHLEWANAVVARAKWGRGRAMSDYLGDAQAGPPRPTPSSSRPSKTACPMPRSTCASRERSAARASSRGRPRQPLKTGALARRQSRAPSRSRMSSARAQNGDSRELTWW